MFNYEENEKVVNKAIRKCICESHVKQFVDFDGKTKTMSVGKERIKDMKERIEKGRKLKNQLLKRIIITYIDEFDTLPISLDWDYLLHCSLGAYTLRIKKLKKEEGMGTLEAIKWIDEHFDVMMKDVHERLNKGEDFE